jgi:CDP-diacylglycerol--glycerol-3-phosphate 3-phosphatidyltransferase
MASVYDLKPVFQKLLHPVCQHLKDSGVTPNQVTVAAIVLSFAMGTLLCVKADSSWPLLVLPAFLLVRMALNAIDGMMAREYNMASGVGMILNELGDVVSDAAVYLPLAVIPNVPALPVVLLVVLAITSEMTGVVAIQVGGTRRYDGPMGKSDRAFVVGVVSILLGFGIISYPWLRVILWAMTGLLLVTIVNRCMKSLKEARQ